MLPRDAGSRPVGHPRRDEANISTSSHRFSEAEVMVLCSYLRISSVLSCGSGWSPHVPSPPSAFPQSLFQ